MKGLARCRWVLRESGMSGTRPKSLRAPRGTLECEAERSGNATTRQRHDADAQRLAFAISPVSEQSRARHRRPARRVAGRKAVFRVHVNGIGRRVCVRFTIAYPPFCIL